MTHGVQEFKFGALEATDTAEFFGFDGEGNTECLGTRRTQQHKRNRREVNEKCTRNGKSNQRDVVTAARLERQEELIRLGDAGRQL